MLREGATRRAVERPANSGARRGWTRAPRRPSPFMLDLQALLRATKTIAVVGLSAHQATTSHRIARYLLDAGVRVIPVNPNHDEVHGRRCYPSVEAIPLGETIDLVNIFRQPRFTAEMVRGVLRRIELTGERPAIWTQLGVSSPEAERLADEAGLVYVRNRCILVEHAR